ncbi:hypothetical protein OYC64_011074 [Pagothenia borchgrevinki]|uniref:Uncharacterized protein n=1 Tax=Pagothenia borchgrevinki TaxID=8213 RepID=A0ABD2GYN2_PAGBO
MNPSTDHEAKNVTLEKHPMVHRPDDAIQKTQQLRLQYRFQSKELKEVKVIEGMYQAKYHNLKEENQRVKEERDTLKMDHFKAKKQTRRLVEKCRRLNLIYQTPDVFLSHKVINDGLPGFRMMTKYNEKHPMDQNADQKRKNSSMVTAEMDLKKEELKMQQLIWDYRRQSKELKAAKGSLWMYQTLCHNLKEENQRVEEEIKTLKMDHLKAKEETRKLAEKIRRLNQQTPSPPISKKPRSPAEETARDQSFSGYIPRPNCVLIKSFVLCLPEILKTGPLPPIATVKLLPHPPPKPSLP